jgi:hypothetical protein
VTERIEPQPAQYPQPDPVALPVVHPADLPTRPVDQLVPYARNSRTHSPEQVAQLAASIREFGFTNPVLIDAEGGIIAGHGRVLAAQSLGLAAVPVLVLDHLSEAQRRAYLIADNKLGLNAGWDEDALRAEIEALGAEGFDLDLTGFDAGELDALLNPPSTSRADPDETPEPPAVPTTVLGDVWLLGGHRLVCGDSTQAEDVAKALNGAKPHLMVTDPPYGVEYDASGATASAAPTAPSYGARAVGQVENDDRCDWREAWALFPGEVAYVWCASWFLPEVAESLAAGFRAPEPRSSGPKTRSRSGAATITGSTSLAGTRSARARLGTGTATASSRPSGRSTSPRSPRPATPPRSPSSACAARSRTTPSPGSGLRAVLRLRHHDHRRRDDRAPVPRHRAQPGLRRRRRPPLGGFRRPRGHPGGDRPDIPRGVR